MRTWAWAAPGAPPERGTYRYETGLTSGYADNRLHSTSVPGPAWANYTHDANGNMTSMPHLASIAYTHADQMRHADLGGGGDAYYTYDAGGERVRKFIQRTGTTTEERISFSRQRCAAPTPRRDDAASRW